MAEKEERSGSIPLLPLITLVGVGSGLLIFFPQLTSSRPPGGDRRLAATTYDADTINARLWQDPLAAAFVDWKKHSEASEAHSIGQFREQMIKKCLAGPPVLPPEAKLRFVAFQKQEHLPTEPVQIMAVMIPGGPYVEDVERRLRSRRAVIEGLGIAGYDPEREHEIGYFCVPWKPFNPNVVESVLELEDDRARDETPTFEPIEPVQPIRTKFKQSSNGKQADKQETEKQPLVVPYEWCEARTFCPRRGPPHLLVLWLRDDAFRDAPLARLADLISWFHFKFSTSELPSLPQFLVLGPDNSGTLHAMVREAESAPWTDKTRECLATTHIYSSQAEAAETRLLYGIPELGIPRTCKHLIEEKVKGPIMDHGFCFERTIPLDNQIVKTLRQELELRDVTQNDDVAILSEEDTFYARALCSSFAAPDVDGEIGPLLPMVHAYTYLRGIDGKLPSDDKDQRETKDADQGTDKDTQSSLRPAEATEGLSQADDIRRLAKMLQDLDRSLRSGDLHGRKSRGLRAIGLLGSDVYDKLELLKALRPMFPEAVFFTNYIDARLAHPDEWKETHDLVVVSARGLSLDGPHKEFQRVAPFRDGGQTALFEATLQAMGQISPDSTPNRSLVFEIGQNGAKELHLTAEKETDELFKVFAKYLLHIGCFITFGCLLVTWTWSVSFRIRTPKQRT